MLAISPEILTRALAKGTTLANLFATHPPLDRRLEQLTQISHQLGRG